MQHFIFAYWAATVLNVLFSVFGPLASAKLTPRALNSSRTPSCPELKPMPHHFFFVIMFIASDQQNRSWGVGVLCFLTWTLQWKNAAADAVEGKNHYNAASSATALPVAILLIFIVIYCCR